MGKKGVFSTQWSSQKRTKLKKNRIYMLKNVKSFVDLKDKVEHMWNENLGRNRHL